MPYHHKIESRVEFSETDMAGIVHFSNLFRFMEKAEASFFREIDFPLIDIKNESAKGWPRVRAHGSFQQPLYFEDKYSVHLYVKQIKIRAIEYFFRIFKLNDNGEIVQVAKGGYTTVYVSRDPATLKMDSQNLPKDLLDKLEECPSECLNHINHVSGSNQ